MRLLYVILAMSLVVLPVYAGTFRDDFENKDDFLNDKQFREGGVWGEDTGQYTWENGVIKGNAFANNFFILGTGNYGLKDYTIECKAKFVTDFDLKGDYIGLVLRRPCIDCRPGYFFFLGNNVVAIIPQGGIIPLKSAPFQTKKDVWYALKAVAQGESFEFYIDNKLVVEVKDNVFPAGKAGLVIQTMEGKQVEALFDDFIMTGPEVEDGGHWDPKAHDQIVVDAKDKLSVTWGNIKHNG